MTRASFVALWLVILLAGSSLAAASASAEPPDFGRCLKLAGGNFKDGGCKKAAVPEEEKYEWYPGFSGEKPIVETGFTLASKPETVMQFSIVGGAVIKCTALSGSGSYTGAKSVSLPLAVITGCELKGTPCTSIGRAAGEIALSPLVGALGVIKKATEPVKTKVGLDLRPQSGTEVAQFSCGLIAVTWRGSVIFPQMANAMKSLATWKSAVAQNGKQKPESFEGGERDVLEQSTGGAPYEELAWMATLIQTNEEKIELSTLH